MLLDICGESVIVQDAKRLSRNSKDGVRIAVVDHRYLSRCDRIYGSYWSSFSQTAKNLNGDEKLIIYCFYSLNIVFYEV